MTSCSIKIHPDGRLEFLYDDHLRPFLDLGPASITRASHIEPTFAHEWIADMSPLHGPQLGPFLSRSAALDAERDWILRHTITTPGPHP